MKVTTDTKKVKQEIRFTMRIENSLYQTIKDSANKFKRSIAKEIEFELEEYNKKINKP